MRRGGRENSRKRRIYVKFSRNRNSKPKKGKYLKNTALTKAKSYDKLLYCINMDKNPFSCLRFNRMTQIGCEISAKEPEKTKVYPKDNL